MTLLRDLLNEAEIKRTTVEINLPFVLEFVNGRPVDFQIAELAATLSKITNKAIKGFKVDSIDTDKPVGCFFVAGSKPTKRDVKELVASLED